MRLLVVGDFHGKFPGKISKVIKKHKIDILVSNGDYLPFAYRELWFKHCFGKETELWEVIGKERYKKLIEKDLRDGERVLRYLNRLSIPVITVLGNMDYHEADDVLDFTISSRGKTGWSLSKDRKDYFANLMRKYKNIHRIDYSYFKLGNLVFIGARGHSNPGKVMSKAFRKHKRILERLFEKFSRENKEGRVIFVSHNVPYKTKLDKIGMHAHEEVRGKHYGSKLVRRIIAKCQPILHVGGHIHEGRGMQKLGRTVCVNPGAVHQGQYAIVELPEGKNERIKIKLIG